MSLPPTWNAGWPQQQMATYGRLGAPATHSMGANLGPATANLAPTMLLAPSSPASQGEQESTQESAAEPCCVNEAREGDEGIGRIRVLGLRPQARNAARAGRVRGVGGNLQRDCADSTAVSLAVLAQAEVPLIALEVGLAAVTVVLMGYCSLADPGQFKKTRNIALDETAHSEHISPGNTVGRSDGMTFRRYDHYL